MARSGAFAKRWRGALALSVLSAGMWMIFTGSGARGRTDGEDAALERARAEVRMLDDLYKNAVVSMTQVYKEGPPAAKVAKDVFAAMRAKGHHDARLVDATGSPLNEANEPKTDFEKRAAEAMQGGKAYFEEVTGEGDKRRLQVATLVPAVLPRCASCHGVKEGDLLGFIRYDLPVR